MQGSRDSERNSFLLFTEKRRYYLECLSDIQNYLDTHSESIKRFKMNNMKGLSRIIRLLIEHVDSFAEMGDMIELVIPEGGKNGKR